MKRILFILFTAYLLPNQAVFAEKPRNFRLNVEYGYNEVSTSLNERWNIRQDVGTSYYDNNNRRVFSHLVMNQIAVKPEWDFFGGKLAFETGLKYSFLNSALDMALQSNGLPAYFFLHYNSTGINTEYTKVHSITENTQYLSIPLELKLIPLKWRNFDVYVKTGVDFGLKINSTTTINFVNNNMDEFHQTILDNVGADVNKYMVGWNNSVGVAYGRNNSLRYRIEALLPSFLLTKNNSSLVNGDVFTGFRFSLQFSGK
jgi:hypothetical protein